LKVSNIATKLISTDDEGGVISFSIKALVENDTDETGVLVELQGLDSDGFEIYDLILEGNIPVERSMVLTTKEDYVDKALYEQIVRWQDKNNANALADL